MSPWDRQATATVQSQQSTTVDQGLRSYLLKVYNYMTSGILLTAVTAYLAGTSPQFAALVTTQTADGRMGLAPLGWVITFAPLAMVMIIGFRARAMSAASLQLAFWGYSLLMGLSLFSIFWAYTEASIFRVLLITAGTFGLMSIYGYTTKKDLTSWGSFLIIGIWAVLIASLVNMFLLSSGLNLALTLIGVVLAVGLIAYDTQKVKSIYYQVGNEEMGKKASILGALSLYIDFVYLFINLLRLMGDRR